MKLVRLVAIWVGLMVGQAMGQGLPEEFEEYRGLTIAVLGIHGDADRDCTLGEISAEDVKAVTFEFKSLGQHLYGRSKPGSSVIEVNVNIRWTAKMAVLFILHELLHAYKICGDDAEYRMNPVPACWIGGKEIMTSYQLNKVLEKHLRRELKAL
jgi:hypothetical protein